MAHVASKVAEYDIETAQARCLKWVCATSTQCSEECQTSHHSRYEPWSVIQLYLNKPSQALYTVNWNINCTTLPLNVTSSSAGVSKDYRQVTIFVIIIITYCFDWFFGFFPFHYYMSFWKPECINNYDGDKQSNLFTYVSRPPPLNCSFIASESVRLHSCQV